MNAVASDIAVNFDKEPSGPRILVSMLMPGAFMAAFWIILCPRYVSVPLWMPWLVWPFSAAASTVWMSFMFRNSRSSGTIVEISLISLAITLIGGVFGSMIPVEMYGEARVSGDVSEYSQAELSARPFSVSLNIPGVFGSVIMVLPSGHTSAGGTLKWRNEQLCTANAECLTVNHENGVLTASDGSVFGSIYDVDSADNISLLSTDAAEALEETNRFYYRDSNIMFRSESLQEYSVNTLQGRDFMLRTASLIRPGNTASHDIIMKSDGTTNTGLLWSFRENNTLCMASHCMLMTADGKLKLPDGSQYGYVSGVRKNSTGITAEMLKSPESPR